MKPQSFKKRNKTLLYLLPIIGILLFITLFIWATHIYPGGSNHDATTAGFNWIHNYWCDLLGAIAKNGTINPARPVAIGATLLLCVSLMFFWLVLPKLFDLPNYRHSIIQYSGILAMLALMFLFTPLHDIVINIAAFLALLALSFTFLELYQNQYYHFLYLGGFCMLILCFNFFIYQTEIGISWLPLSQKIAFIPCFLWIIWMTSHIYLETTK